MHRLDYSLFKYHSLVQIAVCNRFAVHTLPFLILWPLLLFVIAISYTGSYILVTLDSIGFLYTQIA